MSTSVAPSPDLTDAQRIAALEAELAAMKAERDKPSALSTFLRPVTVWITSHGGWAHALASGWGILVTAYAVVPEFQNAVNAGYAATPHWLHQSLAGLVPLILWYKKTQKKGPSA